MFSRCLYALQNGNKIPPPPPEREPSFTRSRATFVTISTSISGECSALAFPYRIRQRFDRSFAIGDHPFGPWYAPATASLFTLNRRVVSVTDHLRNREGFSRQILEDTGVAVVAYVASWSNTAPRRSTTGLLTRQPRLALAPKKLANINLLSSLVTLLRNVDASCVELGSALLHPRRRFLARRRGCSASPSYHSPVIRNIKESLVKRVYTYLRMLATKTRAAAQREPSFVKCGIPVAWNTCTSRERLFDETSFEILENHHLRLRG